MKSLTGVQKLIEEIVEGLITFVYNIVQSFCLLWVRPLRNAVRLNVRAATRKGEQISSGTALFVAACLVVAGPIWQIERMQSLAREVRGNEWQTYVVAAVVIYVIVDLLSRAAARLLTPPRRPRDRTMHIIRYCAAASTVLGGVVLWIGVYKLVEGMFGGVSETTTRLIVAGMLVAAPIAAYPLIMSLGYFVRRRFGIMNSGGVALAYGGVVALVVLIQISAAWLASQSASFSEGLLKDKPAEEAKTEVRISDVACLIGTDGRIAVAAVIASTWDSPVFIPPDMFRLDLQFVGSGTPARRAYPVGLRGARADDLSFQVVKKNEPVTLHLAGQIRPRDLPWPVENTDNCLLHVPHERAIAGINTIEPRGAAMRVVKP